MTDTLTIPRDRNGPPETGQGGYVSGLLANMLGGSDVEVTLRLPPPLGIPLTIEIGEEVARLLDRGAVVAEARRHSLELDVTQPVSFEDALTVAPTYAGLRTHPFPTCLVCGPERPDGTGMRLFPGPVPNTGVVACTWEPVGWTAGEGVTVANEFIWAALDCPGGWALLDHSPGRHAVLGRMHARVVAPLSVGERYVVTAWDLGADGRKMFAGTAIRSDAGKLHAFARTTWIRLEG